jgi:hypothetical protein
MTSGRSIHILLQKETKLSIVYSLVYATFVVFFPWEIISREKFSDFDTYVITFEYYYLSGTTIFDLYDIRTIVDLYTSEVLWNLLMILLTNATHDPEISLRIVSFFILFVFGFLIYKTAGISTPGLTISLLFLLNPAVIDVAMSGIRNGFAWSLILIALWNRSEKLHVGEIALIVVAMFIHSTSLLVASLLYATRYAPKILSGKHLVLFGVVAGVGVGLAITVFNEVFVAAIGDRRVGSDYLTVGGTLAYASIWGVLLFLMSSSGREYVKENTFQISILAWYLTTNLFMPGAFRIWACLLPVIVRSIFRLSLVRFRFFLSLYLVYLLLQYYYWSHLLLI